jgi:hypothetical protein
LLLEKCEGESHKEANEQQKMLVLLMQGGQVLRKVNSSQTLLPLATSKERLNRRRTLRRHLFGGAPG